MTPWQEWKAKNKARQESGVVSPIDVLNPETVWADSEVAAERLATCEQCDDLTIAKTCRICSCFMPLKTRLENATCPAGKW